MIALPLFYIAHSLLVGPIDVEMYRVTIMRIVMEFWKRARYIYDEHSFYVVYSGLRSR